MFLRSYEPEGPPEEIEEIGETMHSCEDQLARGLEVEARLGVRQMGRR